MTDQEINRAVAEARGWETGRFPIESRGETVAYAIARHKESGHLYLGDQDGAPWPPAVCTDPAAWGALFTELAGQGLNPEIAAVGDKFRAAVGPRRRCIVPLEDSPGRALALAFLKAVQP